MAINNDIGKGGEAAARAFLERKGYQIIHTNWHYHHYELDIVAFHEGELVIVEVKTRSQNYLLEPEEAVDLKKIRRTVTAADAYVRFFNYHLPVRFDIITLYPRTYRRCILSAGALKIGSILGNQSVL